MSEDLWVVGGEQRPSSFREEKEWHQFGCAIVARVAGGEVERVLEYESPPEHCPDEKPSHVFKAATFTADTAYLCTQTEVLVCDLPGLAVRRVISHPCFNDLHHVTPGPDGRLWVAVTGLDAVAELAPGGELLRLRSVLPGSPWDRFSPDVDYRKVPTTKPHQAHPNYVFFLDGEPWVTRFQQRDAVPLEANGRPPFRIEIQGVHDGHADGNRIYFTTVDGHVVSFDLDGSDRRIVDLNALTRDGDSPLGWCRGLLPMGNRAWVGFTRIRYTKLVQNLTWVRNKLRDPEYRRLPTRVALYDLEQPALLREVDLETASVGAVFSIHPAVGPSGLPAA